MLPNALITMTGTGQPRAVYNHQYNVIDAISYIEPVLFNKGEHPLQVQWYDHLLPHEKRVIDRYSYYTPAWSERRVNWKVAELIISPNALETYRSLANQVGADILLNMTKFLHADDNVGLRKDLYKRMLFGTVNTTQASALNEGIELSKAIGYQPWTIMIDLEAPTNKAMEQHIKEFNSWSISECKAVGICVSGGKKENEVLYEELLTVVDINLPTNFSNKTAQEKIKTLCQQLHKAGYKVILFSKGMAFKSNSVSYIEVVLHLRDGGSVDVRYQAGARATTPGLRYNGSDYVPKENGYDIYVAFNAKPGVSALRQVMWQMQNDTSAGINKQRPAGATGEFDSSVFYKTVSVGSNQYGTFRWLDQQDAYRYCNHPEVVINLASASLMAFDVSTLDHESINTINQMLDALGTARVSKSEPIAGAKIGGKSKPADPNSATKGPIDKSKADVRQQMEAMVIIFENLLTNTHDIMYLAEEEGLVNLKLDNWDFYSIIRQLDGHDVFVEMFGASGSRIADLLEKMVDNYPILDAVTINQLVRAKLNV